MKKIECEACGHLNGPQEIVLFLGQRAVCVDEWACDQRILERENDGE